MIISRKDVTVWKNNDGYSEVKVIIITKELGSLILFIPSVSDE